MSMDKEGKKVMDANVIVWIPVIIYLLPSSYLSFMPQAGLENET